MQTRTVIRYSILILFLLPAIAFGQDRCGTVEQHKKINPQSNDAIFELWLSKKINARRSNTSILRTKATRKIPVVVHVIHKGEPEGTGTNISDAQILSQISVLNKDYQRLNNDANKTPAIFQPVAGDMDIEFVLARRTPEGLPTNGIVRVEGPPNRDWTSADDAEFKALSYWDSNKYMNIWVVDIIDFLGYAQFPISDLPGLEGSPDAPQTDGIVINPSVFGSDDYGDFDLDPDYNKGRTATHEIGHFFGLRHIWGDDDGKCMNNGGSSDYVDDTPDQENNSVGCPNHPKTGCSGTVAMIQNFMDYTDDVCMNLFTVGQIERMNTVLESSPRRLSLLSSNGLDDPDPVTTENLTIKAISAPVVTCSNFVDIGVKIKNNGVDVTSYKVRITQGETVTTKAITGITFETGDEIEYVVNSVELANGFNDLTIQIIEPNGTDDSYPADNSTSIKIDVNLDRDVVPLKHNFEDDSNPWTVLNPTSGMDWTEIDTNFGTSIYFNGFSNQTYGDKAWLVSPLLDLSELQEASMKFDVSYGYRQGTADNLKVLASTDCGQTFDFILYNETGESIATGAVNGKWKPESEDDWETEKLSLESLLGQPSVRIAFVLTNGNGNNLYVDNIEFFTANNPVTAGETALQVFPNGVRGPAPSLRLNLPERDNIHIEVINSMGQRIKTIALEDALNQTVDLGLQVDATDPDDKTVYTAQQGVYFVRVTGSKGTYVERFVVIH